MKDARENRWGLLGIVCLDCGAKTEFDDPLPKGVHASLTNNGPSHCLVVMLPKTCPDCHNLRAVEEPERCGSRYTAGPKTRWCELAPGHEGNHEADGWSWSDDAEDADDGQRAT